MIKLNLGCGDDYMEGWINVDAFNKNRVDADFDITNIPYGDNTVDEIKAFHIIEHFPWSQANRNLREWYRVLKPGGRLWLETPDFTASCQEFANASEEQQVALRGHIFAHAGDTPGQIHYFLYTEHMLMYELVSTGFSTINRIPPSSGYSKSYPLHLFLCVEAYK